MGFKSEKKINLGKLNNNGKGGKSTFFDILLNGVAIEGACREETFLKTVILAFHC